MAPRQNPYIGPRPFNRDERLPAREREVLELRRSLISTRILLLHSPSGAGKTSLIEAANGLRWAMTERQFHVHPAARVHIPPPAELRGACNRYELSVLRSIAADETIELAELAALGLEGYLARGNPAVSAVGAEPAEAADDEVPLARRTRELLIFDQFEEVLTADPTDVAGRIEFFDTLAQVLDDPYRWALFLLREDFLGALAPWAKRLPTHLSAHYRIDLLRPEAARVAIQAPAAGQGVQFAADALEHLIGELCRTNVQQLDGRMASQAGLWIEPVHLQVVCRRLWSQLAADAAEVTLATVQSLGDVDASLSAFYSEQVAAVTAACGVSERRLRDWISTRLISSRGLRLQVTEGDADDAELSEGVLAALESAYIVRGEERHGVRWFELAHDRLVEPVRRDNEAWEQANLHPMQRQARLWLRESERPEYLLSEEALGQAATWAAEHAGSLTGREEMFLLRSREQVDAHARVREAATRLAIEQQQRLLAQLRNVRNLRVAALLLVALVLCAIGSAVVAWTESEEATRQTRMALQRRDEVNTLIKRLSEDVAPLLGELSGTVELQRELYELIRGALAERQDDLADPAHLNNRFVQHINLGKFEMAHGSLERAFADFDAALALADAVEREFPGDPEVARRKTVAMVNLGALEMRREDYDAARARFAAAMALFDRPDDPTTMTLAMRRNLSVALQQLGELAATVGDVAGAREHYLRGLDIADALTREEPHRIENQRLVVGTLLRLGGLAARGGDRAAAGDYLRRALAVAEALHEAYPLNARVLRDVSLACDSLGELVAADDAAAARGYLERSLEIADVLARYEPDSVRSAYDLLLAHLQFRPLGRAGAPEVHLPRAQEVLLHMQARGMLPSETELARVQEELREWARERAEDPATGP